MAVDEGRTRFDELLALRIVECIALADERGHLVASAHLLTALASLGREVPRHLATSSAAGRQLN